MKNYSNSFYYLQDEHFKTIASKTEIGVFLTRVRFLTTLKNFFESDTCANNFGTHGVPVQDVTWQYEPLTLEHIFEFCAGFDETINSKFLNRPMEYHASSIFTRVTVVTVIDLAISGIDTD